MPKQAHQRAQIPNVSELAPLLGGQSSEAAEEELQQDIVQLRERLAQVNPPP